MNTKFALLIVILFIAPIARAQDNKPAFKTSSGTYYFTHNKPIELKWGDTHFFKDSNVRKVKNTGDTSENYTINSVVDPKYARADITVYPNPFVNSINIKYAAVGELQIELTDITGKYSMRKILTDGERQLDLSGLASSAYFLKIYDSNSQLLQTFKIEKTK